MRPALVFCLLLAVAALSRSAPLPQDLRFQQAERLSRDGGGVSFLVALDGKPVHEAYADGRGPSDASELASGTKSFAGMLALCAAEDGLLTLDEPVSQTIVEWKADPARRALTLRQLLTLTSGIPGTGPGAPIGRPPSYTQAITYPSEAQAGKTFSYGPIPFQVFGEVLRRKLAHRETTVETYLKSRILDPLGLRPAGWRKDADGQPHLPSGAQLTARDWARFGECIRTGGESVLKPGGTAPFFESTAANPAYGLTVWLPARGPVGAVRRRDANASDLPDDTWLAAGAGGQYLVVIPSLGLVAVRQAPVRLRKTGFDEAGWLRALVAGARLARKASVPTMAP